MSFKKKILFFIHFVALSVSAFEENEKFCIRTEAVVPSDPKSNEQRCEITATTLTSNETDSFLQTMCKDLNASSHKKDYQYFKLHNGELAGLASYEGICSGKQNPYLAWVPYKQVQNSFATELNPKEHTLLIGRAYDSAQGKPELCHFQSFDLANNISDNILTCVLIKTENDFFSVKDDLNVLVEILPIMYEVRNVTYLPWKNVTKSYKTMLGKAVLRNINRERKQIFGSINYAFVEKVLLNVSSVYKHGAAHLPLLFEHKGSVLELDGNGIGGVDVKEKAYFGRRMDPKSDVNVDVIGQWAEHHKFFNGEIFEYFGYGIRRFFKEMHNGEVSFVRIESTEPVYEMIESTNLAKSTLHKTHNSNPKNSERFIEEWSDTTESPKSDRLYPNFYPWFVAGCVVVGLAIIAALIGVVRSCSGAEEKQRYHIANKA